MQKNLSHSAIAIVVSRFNIEITQKLLTGAMQKLKELEINHPIKVIWVPGAVEIPVTAQRLAQTQQFSAIICLGAVIKGETAHFEYVCQQVSYGCQKVALDNTLPIIFGVLTTYTEEEAEARSGGKEGNVGCYAAEVAHEMIELFSEIKG